MMLNLLSAISQVFMLCMLVVDIFMVFLLIKYRSAKGIWIPLIVKAVLSLGPFVIMLDREFLKAYDDLENPVAPYFIGFTVLMMVFSAALYVRVRIWSRDKVSADAIRKGVDDLPVGVCFYDEDGSIELVNHRMMQICMELQGKPLTNGEHFWKSVLEVNKSEDLDYALVMLQSGSVFMLRKTSYEDVTELIATDVTEAYHLTRTVEEKNESLQAHNLRLKEYGKNIEELTRNREILETKIQIHDEIGGMLLLAKRSLAEPGNTEIRREALRVLKENTELLAKGEPEEQDNLFEKIRDVAATIGVQVDYTGAFPCGSREYTDIFLNAIHECITNTVSHAGGDHLQVEFSMEASVCHMACTNNGTPPAGEIVEGGGLSSLRKRVSSYGGTMRIIAKPEFILHIELEDRGNV